jgi:two-component system, LytTR family, sensor kinase
MEEFLFKRRYLTFFGSLIISAVAGVYLRRAISYYWIMKDLIPAEDGFFDFSFMNTLTGAFLLPASVLMVLHLIRKGFVYQKEYNDLEKQKLNSELNLLKSQVNQHFLFNTLNNIDSLIFSDQAKASNLVIKLSRILRYGIYETNENLVPLSKEVEYLLDYIGIVSVRMPSEDEIKITTSGDPGRYLIVPMILIPFVENAVKHGDKNYSKPTICIGLFIEHDWMTFTVENYFKNGTNNEPESKGVGLANVRRRLEILYPGRSYLDISKEKNKFKVVLKIQLEHGEHYLHSS